MTVGATTKTLLFAACLPLLLILGGCSHLLGTVGVFGLNKGCTLYGSAAEIEMAESLGRKWVFDATACQIILEPIEESKNESTVDSIPDDDEDQQESTDSGSGSPDSVYSDVVRRIGEKADGRR